jgi:hypothetical protein
MLFQDLPNDEEGPVLHEAVDARRKFAQQAKDSELKTEEDGQEDDDLEPLAQGEIGEEAQGKIHRPTDEPQEGKKAASDPDDLERPGGKTHDKIEIMADQSQH